MGEGKKGEMSVGLWEGVMVSHADVGGIVEKLHRSKMEAWS